MYTKNAKNTNTSVRAGYAEFSLILIDDNAYITCGSVGAQPARRTLKIYITENLYKLTTILTIYTCIVYYTYYTI